MKFRTKILLPSSPSSTSPVDSVLDLWICGVCRCDGNYVAKLFTTGESKLVFIYVTTSMVPVNVVPSFVEDIEM
jgi:hypothetical protein